MRRTFPRGTSDTRRRSVAQRRELRRGLRVGIPGQRRNRAAEIASRRTALRNGRADAKELQMNFKLRVWRQKVDEPKGRMVDYQARDISPDASFLEMLDIVNDELVVKGDVPIAFESDCREGICGTCSLTIDGEAHGPDHPGAACQLYMRRFKDGATITVEPFRAKPFNLVRDLVVNRTSLDRIVQAGGYV